MTEIVISAMSAAHRSLDEFRGSKRVSVESRGPRFQSRPGTNDGSSAGGGKQEDDQKGTVHYMTGEELEKERRKIEEQMRQLEKKKGFRNWDS